MSRNEARRIIDKVRVANGGITPAARANTPEEVLEALDSVRRKLGSATKTQDHFRLRAQGKNANWIRLATNLYSKDTHFLYELIQNAEDNTYSQAAGQGHEPYVRFDVSERYIHIDSNENGFTIPDVKAICSTGDSTKAVVQGFIGEKGIGFKSVFRVASKVHIQSGPFSFYFLHENDGDGLGMVTPINEEHTYLPNDVRTRISLTIKESVDFRDIKSEIDDIPDTLLLFLKKLRSITIIIRPPSSPTISTHYRYWFDKKSSLGKIIKTSNTEGSIATEDLFSYLVTKTTVRKLPKHDSRPNISQADIVLAFPLDKNQNPIIKPQHVYAFLPLRDAGFNVRTPAIYQGHTADIRICDSS